MHDTVFYLIKVFETMYKVYVEARNFNLSYSKK